MTRDYAITIKITNGRIKTAMQNAGIKNTAELARMAGVSQSAVGKIINLKRAPLTTAGEWSNSVLKIADALGVLPDELFNSSQRIMAVQKNQVTKFVSQDEIHRFVTSEMNVDRLEFLQDNAAIEELQEKAVTEICEEAMKESLTAREIQVLKLHTVKGLTLSEISEQFGVSRTRVQQIERQALSKLRANKMIKKLRTSNGLTSTY